MEKDNNILSDLTKLAGSAFSTALDIKREIATFIQQQVEVFIKGMNFATKEELEVLKTMLEQCSKDIAELKSRQGTATSKEEGENCITEEQR